MSRTILLADDSLTIQKVVELTFADTEYEVLGVSSGDELLEKLPEVRPDLVICDVIMPGRDGYDVCQEIKSSSEFLHLPVILLTGTFEPFDRDRALAAGCSEIITKPFEARKLVDAVERLSNEAGAALPPAAATAPEEPENLGQVTPPPPIVLPDELTDAEQEPDLELEDTAVTPEVAVPAPIGAGEAFEADTDSRADSPSESPPEDIDFEFAAEPATTQEVEAGELAESVETDDFAFTPPSADSAATLASSDIEELMGSDEAEPFAEAPEIEVAPESAPDEPFQTEDAPAIDETPEFVDTDNSLTSPIDVAAVMADPGIETEETASDRQKEPTAEDHSGADTQDFGEEEVQQLDAPEGESLGLSDADIDRIARRVLELAGDRIDHIAWDVIPDMAEVVVRERLREIEAVAEES